METLRGKGGFVISLDFEMMWGNIESWTVDGYGKSNVANVRKVIDRLLTLFEKFQVKATFATVGFLMQDHGKVSIPDRLPSYTNSLLSPYGSYMNGITKNNAHLFFASDIIKKLKESPFVEIGTHTYCHYYCSEMGQTKDEFDADIDTAVKVASKHGIQLKSIVFPRNQVTDDYLDICKKHGIMAYRGNPEKYFSVTSSNLVGLKNRICRLLDAYVYLGGRTSYKLSSKSDGLLNIRASRFLRPYSHKLSFLEGLRFRRIRKEMEYAAKHDEVYHLWWHPHNFGSDMDKNFAFLKKILSCYQHLHNEYDWSSRTMGSFV